MNNKPMIFANDDFSEGVYAASGGIGTDCWKVEAAHMPGGGAGEKIFQITLTHTHGAGHASKSVTIKCTFNIPVRSVRAENADYKVLVSGNDVTITRYFFANGGFSGDRVTYHIWVEGLNDAEINTLAVTSAKFVNCEKIPTPNTGADT